MLTESQIASREHTIRSLKELFEFSGDYSSVPTEAARANVSQPNTKASTYHLVSFGEQAGSSTALHGPSTLGQDDLGITSNSLENRLFLLLVPIFPSSLSSSLLFNLNPN
jgi:hypothetical protein